MSDEMGREMVRKAAESGATSVRVVPGTMRAGELADLIVDYARHEPDCIPDLYHDHEASCPCGLYDSLSSSGLFDAWSKAGRYDR